MTTTSTNQTHARARDVRWQAVIARDSRHDGRFVLAVKTTGIYCRPSCPARRPKRTNVEFFDTGAEARDAGYRSCKRCRPDGPGVAQEQIERVRKACQLIDAADEPPRLNELAAAVGQSPAHFHRQFKRLLGVTPKEYAGGKRVQRLQDNLNGSVSVTEAIYASGYGSASRVYESSTKTLGMTPATYKSGGEGVSIRYTVADSPLGRLLVAATETGVCCIAFGDSKKTLEKSLKTRFPAAGLKEDERELKKWVAQIIRFVKTPARGLALPLDIQGTAFQQRVWQALQAIPVGETTSYGAIAKAIGQPTAQRAVAQACGANKLALAIPCHRVVRSNGELGGYRWGVERKRRLLETERQEKS